MVFECFGRIKNTHRFLKTVGIVCLGDAASPRYYFSELLGSWNQSNKIKVSRAVVWRCRLQQKKEMPLFKTKIHCFQRFYILCCRRQRHTTATHIGLSQLPDISVIFWLLADRDEAVPSSLR
jgi:hypothetical protein